MKTMLGLLSFSLVIVFCNISFGQSDENKIRKLEELERLSFLKVDTGTLYKLWDTHFVVTNQSNDIFNKSQLKSLIRKGIMDYTNFSRNIELISFSNNTATVMGIEITGNEAMRPAEKLHHYFRTDTRRFTDVWTKDKETWKLVARQTTTVTN